MVHRNGHEAIMSLQHRGGGITQFITNELELIELLRPIAEDPTSCPPFAEAKLIRFKRVEEA